MNEGAMEGEVQNQTKMILDRLDSVDATLAGIRADHEHLMERWTESANDRATIHERIATMERERGELLEKAKQYQEAIEVRMQAVESRDAITDIRTTVTQLRDAITEVQAAAALLITVHRWWKKPRSRVTTAIGTMAMLALTPNLGMALRFLFTALLHWFGWH